MTTTTTQILVTEELVSFKPLVIRETFTIQINGRPVIHPEFASRQAAALRDLVGNPFRPVRWSSCGHCHGTGWRTKIDHDNPGGSVSRPCRKCGPNPTVLSLATAAYEYRNPDGTLDPVRLLVLSDAMEEAGCGPMLESEGPPKVWVRHPLLAHLRSAGPHCRGCWVVDLILGRE